MSHLPWANFQSRFSDSVTSLIPSTIAAHLILWTMQFSECYAFVHGSPLCGDTEPSEGRYYLEMMQLYIL